MTDSKSTPAESTDVIERCIGGLGRWHIWMFILISSVKVAVALNLLNIVFVAPPAEFWCSDKNVDKCSEDCTSYEYDKSIFSNTIIMQWDLVCNKQYLASLTQTITMLGSSIGNSVGGYFSDKYGRRGIMVSAAVVQVASGLGGAFAPWLPLFLALRFLTSFATGAIMITSFVMVMEMVGKQWRSILGVLYQLPFILAYTLMPGISYLLRDWRYFQVAINLPSLVFVAYYWILPESPRWQLAAGFHSQATEELKKIAKMNSLPTDKIDQEITAYLKEKSEVKEEIQNGNVFDLFKSPVIRMYTIIMWVTWFFSGLSFYGVTQFLGQLGGNIFANVAAGAAVEIPGVLIASWLIENWGRKKTAIFGNILGGLALLIGGFLPEDPAWLRPTFAAFGVGGSMMTFSAVYIYGGELFPTVVRNIGIGTASTWARIGSMIAPFIATMSGEPWVIPTIFASTMIFSALLCLMLPETINRKLPETIEEVEQLKNSNKSLF